MPLQLSLLFFPSRIERNADTIMAIITKKPIPKNAQNRISTMATPFPGGARIVRLRVAELILFLCICIISFPPVPVNWM